MKHCHAYLISLGILILGLQSEHSFVMAKEETQNCTESPYSIIIDVQGLRNSRGTVKAKLYGDNAEDFLVTGKKLDSERVRARQDATSLCLNAHKPGTYAVLLHHDENGNKKLDQNWIGMPTEGVGFSNNPKLFLAPPNHEDVTFDVLGEQTYIDINMQY